MNMQADCQTSWNPLKSHSPRVQQTYTKDLS